MGSIIKNGIVYGNTTDAYTKTETDIAPIYYLNIIAVANINYIINKKYTHRCKSIILQ